MGPRFRVSFERLEKPRIEPTTPVLEGEQLNHYATEASFCKVETEYLTHLFYDCGVIEDVLKILKLK